MSDCREASNREIKIRQFQRALYLKSKQEETFRFYSLYDKIWREDVLWEAWHQVKANKGAPGIDEITIEEIVASNGEMEMISRLQNQLKDQCYQFSPVRQVEIPKPKGGTRPLGIGTVKEYCTYIQSVFGICYYHPPISPVAR
jgi:RNA-directed DNA polymerase